MLPKTASLALVYMALSKFKSASRGKERHLKHVLYFQCKVNALRIANLLLLLNLGVNSLPRIENTLVQRGSAALRPEGLCVLPRWDGQEKGRPLPVLCGVRQSLRMGEGSQ